MTIQKCNAQQDYLIRPVWLDVGICNDGDWQCVDLVPDYGAGNVARVARLKCDLPKGHEGRHENHKPPAIKPELAYWW